MRNLNGETENKPGINIVNDPVQRERLARNAMLEYNLKLSGVKKICQGFVTELESNQDEMAVVEEINRILKLKNTNAPRRPQRIILMGSPGSKKEQYAVRIAEKYQLVYVQLSQMLTEAVRRNDDNDYARQLKSYIANDRTVPDDVVIDLVQERLSRPDCKLNGWILDGCPFNLKQIEMLRDLKIEPQKVISVESSFESVLEELSNMKIHEASGKLFTPAEAEAADEEIRSTLIPRNMAGVQHQVDEYQKFLIDAQVQYSRHLVRINGMETSENVYLSFCDAIESSL